MITKGAFKTSHSNRDGITLTRDKISISFSAAEADKITQLIQMCMRVESYPVLPNKLQFHPFECSFSQNRTMELRHQYNPHLGIVFSFNEGDDLIWVIRQAKNSFLNNPSKPNKNFHSTQTPDPLF